MKELLVALYALTIYYTAGGKKLPTELYQTLNNPALKPYMKQIPGFNAACKAVLASADIDFEALAADLNAFVKEYAKDPSSKASVKSVLQSFVSWFRSGNEGAFKRIEQFSASPVFPTWILPFFSKQATSQKPITKKLDALVGQMTGEQKPAFESVEEAAQAKIDYPELYQHYLVLRREFNQSWKDALSTYVRKSGSHLVDFKAFETYLASQGLEHSLPTGFTGKIDAAGRWYDQDGEELNGVPSATIFPRVRMNTTGDGTWIAQAIRKGGGGGGYIFRKSDVKQAQQEKYQKVKDFIPKVDKIRAKWLMLIKSYDYYKPESVAALVLELVFQFSARIGGSAGMTDGKQTYGISSINVGHVSFTQNGFNLTYLGKAGVKTKHRFVAENIVEKKMVEIVTTLCKDKKPKDPLFTFWKKNGYPYPITPGMVNKVFRALGAGDLSVKYLRTYWGSRIFKEEMEKLFEKKKSMPTAATAMEYLKVMAIKVGKALNHVRRSATGVESVTPSTALNAYIDPSLQVEYFAHYGLPLPSYLEKLNVEASTIKTGVVSTTHMRKGYEHDDAYNLVVGPEDMAEELDETQEEMQASSSYQVNMGYLNNALSGGGSLQDDRAMKKDFSNYRKLIPVIHEGEQE